MEKHRSASTATLPYLVKLYESWGKPEEAAVWRAKLPTEQEVVASDQPAKRQPG